MTTTNDDDVADALVASFGRLTASLEAGGELLQKQSAALEGFGQSLRDVARVQVSALRRYRLLFEEAPDPYLVTDADGVVREANAAARDLLRTETSLVDAKLVNFIAPEQRVRFEGWFDQIRRGAPDARWDTVLDIGTGEFMPIEISLADDLDDIGYRWVLREQRERVAAEEHLHQVAATEHLAASELRTASRAKTELLVSLSHDLRGPIGAIVHQAELLNTPGLSEAVRKRSHGAVQQNATLLTQLLDALVEIERFALGELELETEPTLVADVVHDLPDTDDHLVQVMLPDEDVVAEVDREAIRRALRTLTNTMHGPSPDSSLVVEVFLDHDDEVLVTISAAQDIASTFEDRIGTRLARTLIELHGGHLRVGQIGDGHGVTVSLPVVRRGESPS